MPMSIEEMRLAARARDASPSPFKCAECGHEFGTVEEAERASFGEDGCPSCGGSDIELTEAAAYVDCPDCNGEGEIEVGSGCKFFGWEGCARCGGEGFTPDNANGPGYRRHAKGSGRLEVAKLECAHCGAAGIAAKRTIAGGLICDCGHRTFKSAA